MCRVMVCTAFGGALGRDGAVNEVLDQEECKGKALDREPSLRGLDHKSSLTALGRKASLDGRKNRTRRGWKLMLGGTRGEGEEGCEAQAWVERA